MVVWIKVRNVTARTLIQFWDWRLTLFPQSPVTLLILVALVWILKGQNSTFLSIWLPKPISEKDNLFLLWFLSRFLVGAIDKLCMNIIQLILYSTKINFLTVILLLYYCFRLPLFHHYLFGSIANLPWICRLYSLCFRWCESLFLLLLISEFHNYWFLSIYI